MSSEESSPFGNHAIFPHASGTQIHGGTFITVQGRSENVAVPLHIASITNATNQTVRDSELSQSLPQDVPDWKEIHRKCVERLGKGNVLWDPTPDRKGTPQSYQRRGPRIGDVGMLSRQGNFRYNFNMTLPANHSDNVLRVPARFQPFTGIDNPAYIDVTTTESDLGHRATFPLSTTSMIWNEQDKHHKITLTTPSPPAHGVLMFFGDGLESEQLAETGPESPFVDWVRTRAYNWYKHLMSRQFPVANGDLQVVVGTEKASYWLTATVSRIVSNINDFSFVVKYYPKPIGDFNTRCLYEHNGALWTHVLTGPGEGETAALRTRPNQKLRNQAMFLKTMTATLTEDEWTKLQKEVKLKSPAELSQPCPGTTLSRTSAPMPSRGSKSTQANVLAKRPLWMRSLVQSNVPTATSSIMTSDEAYLSSEDDYDRVSESSPLSSDECQPDDELEKPADQQLQWIGVENHPSRLLNKALIKEAPTAKLAITSDEDWIRVLREDDELHLDPQVLVARILASHDIIVKNSMVSVYPRADLKGLVK